MGGQVIQEAEDREGAEHGVEVTAQGEAGASFVYVACAVRKSNLCGGVCVRVRVRACVWFGILVSWFGVCVGPAWPRVRGVAPVSRSRMSRVAFPV